MVYWQLCSDLLAETATAIQQKWTRSTSLHDQAVTQLACMFKSPDLAFAERLRMVKTNKNRALEPSRFACVHGYGKRLAKIVER